MSNLTIKCQIQFDLRRDHLWLDRRVVTYPMRASAVADVPDIAVAASAAACLSSLAADPYPLPAAAAAAVVGD